VFDHSKSFKKTRRARKKRLKKSWFLSCIFIVKKVKQAEVLLEHVRERHSEVLHFSVDIFVELNCTRDVIHGHDVAVAFG
jgi:putative IMPACT (imprinted ancient) family translation regulator